MDSIQANEVLEKIGKNEYVGYDHVAINGNLDLSRLDLLEDNTGRYIVPALIRIDNSIINGNIYFNDGVFTNYISFKNTTFNGIAYFQGSSFNRDADFQ